MIKGPLFSIITINYNDCVGLQRTLDSVVNQSYQDFEYVVIDGGSDDGSKDLLDLYNDKIDYCISEKDTGVYNAMNKGLVKATGQYVLFLNGGDHFYNLNTLEDNYKKIHSEDLVYFNISVALENESYIKTYPTEITFSYLFKDTLPHPATFIKKTLFDKIGLYDEGLKIVSDWKFFILALAKYNASYRYVNTVFSTFYFDGISSDKENVDVQMSERQSVIDSEFSILKKDTEELISLKRLMVDLKASRKIKWLTKFKLINKF